MGATASSADKRKEARVLVLGLNGSGKTSILERLRINKFVPVDPTIGWNYDQVQRRGVTIHMWEYRGGCIPRIWQLYLSQLMGGIQRPEMDPSTSSSSSGIDALVFVVDSEDAERIEEAREILHATLNDVLVQNVRVLLVLANKQDLTQVMDPDDIEHRLGLTKYHLIRDAVRSAHSRIPVRWFVRVVPCSAVTGKGLEEGMDYLVRHIKIVNNEAPLPTIS